MTTGNAKKKTVTLVLVIALGWGLVAEAYSVIPVFDAANYASNWQQAIQQYISMGYLLYQLTITIREGEWYSILMMHLNNLGMFFPDADVGSFTGDIADARNAFQGFTGGYGSTKSAMNEVFGGGRELVTPKWNQIEFMDAAATRVAKEIGTYRAGRATRDQRLQQLISRANGETGQDRQLQLVNVNLANLYAAVSDQTLMTASTNELLSTEVEALRAEVYRKEEAVEAVSAALVAFAQGGGGSGPEEIEIP